MSFEGPALIAESAAAQGLRTTIYRMDLGHRLPAVDDIDGMIVLGGPMSVADAGKIPHLAAELQLIKALVRAGVPVLGICLGAQLLASAAGATIHHGGPPEVGPGWVTLTTAARMDPVFCIAPDPLPVFHWHHDTFDLPQEATLLAGTVTYPHQAFRLGRASYGLQFHIELGQRHLERLQPYLPIGVPILSSAGTETIGRELLNRFLQHVGLHHSQEDRDGRGEA